MFVHLARSLIFSCDGEQELLLECAGAKLNYMILDFICPWLATSPMARANGIACCSHTTFFAWRGMWYPFFGRWLQGVIDYVKNVDPEVGLHPSDVLLSLLDLGDVYGLET